MNLRLARTVGRSGLRRRIYNDGATTGTNLALYIDGPNSGGPYVQSISNRFVAAASGTASSLDFGMWVTTGSTPTAAS